MDATLIGVIFFVILFALLAIGMPIGFTLAFVAFVGMIFVGDLNQAIGLLGFAPFTTVSNYIFGVVPLFVLMGYFTFTSGLTSDAYRMAYTWIGHRPGGLAMATIAACAGLAACTGSSAASVGLITSTALPEMERYKYDSRLSSGSIASGATLGILIPPSVPLIVYGLFSGTSIGQLFISGIIPGIMLTIFFILCISIWTRINPRLGPSGPATTWREKFNAIKYLWSAVLLAGLVLFGIWGGIFTPVEAGSVGCVGALIIALARKKLSGQVFITSVKETVKMGGMLFIIMIGAIMFNTFLALTGLPALLASATISAPLPPTVVLILIMLFYLVGGCLMDSLGLMLLTLPIFIPIMVSLHIDLVLFGLLTVLQIEMAEITPPIGINVFILRGMANHIPINNIFVGIAPFLACILILLALIVAFPQIALFLPGTMM
ncbi:MAG: TRAP transporter large permease [Dehalococcoidales bacterium]|nr:TRAP transporter large permease [Dehalococcoidales bacterium]